MGETFDYIIIGAGSAGCVLANRLSADPARRVLLLEAGGANRDFFVRMPKGTARILTDPKLTWRYPVQGDRVESWLRGKGLGGSSAVNGLLYVRGHPQDYDDWERAAGPDWGWAAMKRAFRSIEDHELGDDGVRGVGGPVHISVNRVRYPLAERLIAAGEEMGLPRHEDLNSEDQEGVGYYCYNIKNGRRQTAAVAFLDPIEQRDNLRIKTGVLVHKILFADKRAVGVECRIDGRKTIFHCSGEVLLSAGAVASPKLLQQSGIGDARLLRRHGIKVVHDSPDVGHRMREHLGLTMTYRLKNDPGINHRLRGLGLLKSGLEYLFLRKGLLANGVFEVGAFVRASEAADRPNLQLCISGWSPVGGGAMEEADAIQAVDKKPGMTVVPLLLNLQSEASVEIMSADPDAPLMVTPNWLSNDHDKRAAIDMVKYVRRFVARASLAPFIEEELAPGSQVVTDGDILAAVSKSSLCGTHAVGSCRMGLDEGSVVDERARVRGVSGLRVVDCSIMPGLVSGNTNGPAMAVAWRAADLILSELAG